MRMTDTPASNVKCIEYQVPLVILSVAFMSLLTINIVHFAKKHKKGKEMKYYSQCTISYDQCIENNPIYGNLDQLILEETEAYCYEPMATAHERHQEDVQLEPEEQTCYASLDLSPKRPGKNRRKKPKPIKHQNMEDKPVSVNGKILSRPSIYLNSEELTAECQAEEDLIHDDPVRIYPSLQKTRKNVTTEENEDDWSNEIL